MQDLNFCFLWSLSIWNEGEPRGRLKVSETLSFSFLISGSPFQGGIFPTHNREHCLAHDDIHNDNVCSTAGWKESSHLRLNKDLCCYLTIPTLEGLLDSVLYRLQSLLAKINEARPWCPEWPGQGLLVAISRWLMIIILVCSFDFRPTHCSGFSPGSILASACLKIKAEVHFINNSINI